MEFELNTLEEYSEDSLLSELQRVASIVEKQNLRLTLNKFNSMSRAHSTTFRTRFGSWATALDRAGISDSLAPRFKTISKEDLLDALKQFAAENPNQPVTVRAIADRMGVNRTTITRRVGRWSTLLAQAGISPVPLGRRYSDEERYENILKLWSHYGRQPKFGELRHSPSTVGPKAYIIRWGGWRAALSAFVKRVNQPSTAIEQGPELDSLSPEVNSNQVTFPSRTLGLALRYRILKRDRFTCVACGASPSKNPDVELHVDHILAWSRAGTNTEENLRTLCSKCNLGKGCSLEVTNLS
jgi:hypothetical protein